MNMGELRDMTKYIPDRFTVKVELRKEDLTEETRNPDTHLHSGKLSFKSVDYPGKSITFGVDIEDE